MSKENDEDIDNIELNKAIADSISSLNYQQDEDEKSHEESGAQDDIDLENAIGDVFKQFDFGETSDKQDDSAPHVQHEDYVPQEYELNEAIGNAFESIDVNKQTNDQSQNAAHTSAEIPKPTIDAKESSDQKDEGLDDVIGNVIGSLNDGPAQRDEKTHTDVLSKEHGGQNEDSQPQDIDNDIHNEDEPIGDDDLEKAIRDALGGGHTEENKKDAIQKEADTTQAPHHSVISDTNKLEPNEQQAKVNEVVEDVSKDNQHEEITDATDELLKYKQDDELNMAIASAFSNIATENNEDKSSEQDNKDETDDLDLSSAIGDAFKNIPELTRNEYESRPGQPVEKVDDTDYTLPKPNDEDKDSHDDKLTSTINNALKEFISSNDEARENSQDDDLNDAISASFRQLIGDNDNDKKGEINHSTEPAELSIQLSNKNDKQDNIDSFLENVISEAFRNVTEQAKASQDISTLKEAEPEKQGESGFDLSSLVQTMVNQMSHVEENTKLSQGTLPISEDILQELALEITNQVQDQIDDESHKKAKTITDMPQIDENVLAHFQNEAYKDDKYKDSDKIDGNKTLPDDNALQAALATAVRNAIGNNATTFNDSNRRLSISQGAKHDNEQEDLEQLQMNDILQNAFNMAMENPHDLLSNLEMEDETVDHHQDKNDQSNTTRSQSSQVASALARLPHPLPASTTTFLESLNRSNDIDLSDSSSNRKRKPQGRGGSYSTTSESITSQTDRISAVAKNIVSNFANKNLSLNNKDELKKNNLSIAETLALHRSSMNNGPRRDYSSIEALRDGTTSSSTPINSQVSNVLSSLSSRINTTSGADNNLLQVIRQMTSALTSKPTSSSSYTMPASAPTVSDIINSYKDKRDEYAIISPLVLAKKFLEEKQVAPKNGKAISLLNNVLELFNSNQESSIDPSIGSAPYLASQYDLENVKSDFISTISSSVSSAISSFNSRSKRASFFGERLKTDSPEYKERIRLENRERKKKWREENAERNKDNDLRSRVLKRATLMFGEKDTQEKKAWVDDEFNKRREKRIAKQKKDEYDRQTKGFDDENLDRKSFNSRESNALVHDPNLIRPVTDIFNIVSNSVHDEDPEAALAATSAATATAAAIYASTHNTTNFKMVESAVSKILLSLMENSHSVNQDERIANLSKGVTSTFKIDSTPSEMSSINKQSLPSKLPDSELTSLVKTNPTSTSGILNRLSASIKGFSPSTISALYNTNNVSSLLQLQNLKLGNNQDSSSQKRKSIDTLPHEVKRSRPSSPLSEPKSLTENATVSEASSNDIEGVRNLDSTSSNSSHLWNSSNVLKMPHYKKPDVFSATSIDNNTDESNIDPAIKKEYPTLSLASSSPFISNKANYLSGRSLPSTNASQATTLKKPGIFQRPNYSKSEKKKMFGSSLY